MGGWKPNPQYCQGMPVHLSLHQNLNTCQSCPRPAVLVPVIEASIFPFFSNAKAKLDFASKGSNISKFCWDLERCPVAITHSKDITSQVTRLSPGFQVHTPGQHTDIWFGLVRFKLPVSFFYLRNVPPCTYFGRKFPPPPRIFRDDGVVDKFMSGCCHFPLLEFLRRFSGKLLTLQPWFWQFE